VHHACNAHLSPRELEAVAPLPERLAGEVERFASRAGLSARGYGKVLRVARTIADLAGADDVAMPHLLEAMALRIFDRRSGAAHDVTASP
jgi:magnesium chelatase family protein